MLPNSLESIGCAAIVADVDLNDSNYYLKRELSYMQFNLRVLVQVRNKQHPLLERLNFILSLEGKDAFGRDSSLAIEPAPRALLRQIKVPSHITPEGDNFIFLYSVIHEHVEEFFPGMTVKDCHQFRLTRNSDLEVSNVEVEEVASALQGELHLRRFGAAAKIEVGAGCPAYLTNFLLERFNLTKEELFRLDSPVNLQRLMALFSMINREDQFLLYPYQSFIPVIDWVRQAARNPGVISMKKTLYRTNES